MKIQDVRPTTCSDPRRGFDPDAQEIVAMRIHGVTPEYQAMLDRRRFEVDTQDVIHAKVIEITPEFIRKANAHGWKT